MAKAKPKATGYDKYVNWKLFFIPVVLFFAILILPTPYGMKDVGTEIQVGPTAVVNLITTELFDKKSSDAAQWELLTAQIMEKNMRMGALSKDRFLKRDLKWCKKYKIQADSANLKRSHAFIKENVSDIRNSRVADLVSELTQYGVDVDVTDPSPTARSCRMNMASRIKKRCRRWVKRSALLVG